MATPSPASVSPEAPSALWRASSSVVMGLTGSVSRLFLLGASDLQVNGLDKFLRLLDEREDPAQRERGLITVSNHLSVYDDPLMWGSLPFRYVWSPDNLRWGLGSHDLMFNKSSSPKTFWNLGQVLPAHRAAHSPHGGLFQPTITQCIRLLSAQPFTHLPPPTNTTSTSTLAAASDPFTAASLTYTTTGADSFPAPAAYASRRHAWVHIFPEGMIHQHPDKIMRYMKWGVSRLILEAEPCPAVVPIWIDGFQEVMHEARGFPRPVPRVGKKISVSFGDGVDVDGVFGDVRRRWRELVAADRAAGTEGPWEMGVLSERLKYSNAARRLREETTLLVREEVLKVRRAQGFPDEDPKARLVDTWWEEGRQKREGEMADGSWVKDT